MYVGQISVVIIQLLLILTISPLLLGCIKKIKALFQSRRGPSILQPYYDLIKYMKKDAVISNQSSWLTIITPYVSFAAVLIAGLLIPMFSIMTGLGFIGDIILFIYLLGAVRFFTAITALDAGSSFGGMGASREMSFNTMVEPALFLAIIAVTLQTGTTHFGDIIRQIHAQGWSVVTLSYILAFFAMLIVIIAETGRIPVDNPDTHLELTMMHEGMLLEYSGRYLGLMMWSSMMKQFVLLSLFACLFFPIGIAQSFGIFELFLGLALFILKVFGLGVLLAVIEMTYAKIRIYQLPRLFLTSMMFSILAIIASIL